MSSLFNCISCKNEFDSQERIPLTLPCNSEHAVCTICLFEQYLKEKLNKCPHPLCLQISKINPRDLPKNQNALDQLQKKFEVQAIEEQIQIIKDQRDQCLSVLKLIMKKKISLSKKILQLLQETLFKNSNKIINDLKQRISTSNKKLCLYQTQLQQIQQNSINQVIIENKIETKQEIETLSINGSIAIKILDQYQDNMQQMKQLLYSFINEKIQLRNYKEQLTSQELNSNSENAQQNQQEKQSNYIHRFLEGKNLHLFDIQSEQYKLVQSQNEVLDYSRSIEYQDKIYLVGGYQKSQYVKKV